MGNFLPACDCFGREEKSWCAKIQGGGSTLIEEKVMKQNVKEEAAKQKAEEEAVRQKGAEEEAAKQKTEIEQKIYTPKKEKKYTREYIVQQRQKTLGAVTGQSHEKRVREFSEVGTEDIADKVVEDFETLWTVT